MKGKTSTGFEFDIEDERLDDMNSSILWQKSMKTLLMPKLCKMLLGEEQKKRLYDHLRSEDGRVPIEATTNAIQEIFNSPGDLKNS